MSAKKVYLILKVDGRTFSLSHTTSDKRFWREQKDETQSWTPLSSDDWADSVALQLPWPPPWPLPLTCPAEVPSMHNTSAHRLRSLPSTLLSGQTPREDRRKEKICHCFFGNLSSRTLKINRNNCDCGTPSMRCRSEWCPLSRAKLASEWCPLSLSGPDSSQCEALFFFPTTTDTSPRVALHHNPYTPSPIHPLDPYLPVMLQTNHDRSLDDWRKVWQSGRDSLNCREIHCYQKCFVRVHTGICCTLKEGSSLFFILKKRNLHSIF